MSARLSRRFLGLMLLTAALPCTLLSDAVAAEQLHLHEYECLGRRFTDGLNWISVSVTQGAGEPVLGIPVDNFALTEAIISPTAGVIEGPLLIDLQDQAADPWSEGGCWEYAATPEMIDVVVLVDISGSMAPALPEIRTQLHALVDRLVTHHLDFRFGIMVFEGNPNTVKSTRLYGAMELDEIRAQLDGHWLDDAGEWWVPTVAYDALLVMPWMGLRQEAQQMAVVITDVVPQTVYGAFWYAIDCSAASMSSIEHLLARYPNLDVYYCQNPAQHGGVLEYVQADKNPWAGDSVNGFDALRDHERVHQLNWPFRQNDLPLSSEPVTDVLYYLAWETGLSWYGQPDDCLLRLHLTVQNPADPDHPVSLTQEVPLEQPAGNLDIQLLNAAGLPFEPIWVDLFRSIGHRSILFENGLHGTGGGVTANSLPYATYNVVCQDSGAQYEYANLRAMYRGTIQVVQPAQTANIVVPAADATASLAKARGLVADLAALETAGRPFARFAVSAEHWLDTLENRDLTWEEMVALKRFFMALSGYANLSQYAREDTERAIENFNAIVDDVREIIARTVLLEETTRQSWEEALAEGLLDVLYGLLTGGEVIALKTAVETGVDQLVEYAAGELLDELKNVVISHLPDDRMRAYFELLLGADFNNWQDAIEVARLLWLGQVVDAALDQLASNAVEQAWARLSLTPGEDALAPLLQDVIDEFVRSHDLIGLDVALEQFAQDIAPFVLVNGHDHRDEVAQAVASIFAKLQAEVEAASLRHFLLPLLNELTLAAIPEVHTVPAPGGASTLEIVHGIEDDRVVKALVEHGLYQVVLRDLFADPANTGLNQALARAFSYVPAGQDPEQWEIQMRNDFQDYRRLMQPLAENDGVAWNSLTAQEQPEAWANLLDGLVAILTPLNEALDTIANLYPALQDTATALNLFIATLDGVEIIPRAISFGMQTDALAAYGDAAEPLYLAVFPDPPGLLSRMAVTPLSHDFGGCGIGETSEALSVRIWNTGSQPLNVASIVLSDTQNFTLEPASGDNLTPIIEQGRAYEILVRFVPVSILEHTATLTVTCPAATPPEVAVHFCGRGYVIADLLEFELLPRIVRFGSLTVAKETASSVVTISNTGSVPLLVTGMELSDTENFRIDDSSSIPLIPANATHQVVVWFEPQETGQLEATLTVAFEGAEPSEQIVTLRGTGKPAQSSTFGCQRGSNRGAAAPSLLVLLLITGLKAYGPDRSAARKR